jgi:hypothetical protein
VEQLGVTLVLVTVSEIVTVVAVATLGAVQLKVLLDPEAGLPALAVQA